jgi:hypothetical protein
VLKDEADGSEFDMNAKAVELYAKEIEAYEKAAQKVFENNGDKESAVTEFIKFLKELNLFEQVQPA